MQKKVVVISLGGSLIVPEKIDPTYLPKFIKVIRKRSKKNKFVLVCGGGTIARKYISTLKAQGRPNKELAEAGIRATRMNARFVMQLFGEHANKSLPENMKDVKDYLEKNDIVICGALRYEKNSTSDGTAAKIADYLKAGYFINITDVRGLYSDNPKTNPKAKFIPQESWKAFEARALKIKHHPGQHFVLDQQAATMIRKNKIKTYIISGDVKNLNKLLKGKNFVGTKIEG